MATGEIPQAVLAERLAEKIAGRRVRVAVFTTFSFDPGFFEVNILPTLFDTPYSQVEKVKRIQLDDDLQSVEQIAVYYDRTALAQDASPAQLDFQRIGVRGPKGVFHPKLVLVLVENQPDGYDLQPGELPPESLIVGLLSANLTRAGWWENLEVGHFEEMHERQWTHDKYSYRRDLLSLIRRIQKLDGPPEEQVALSRIREFLVRRTPRATRQRHRSGGHYYTRIFCGQSDLPSWLEEVRLAKRDWNLEVISPYFDSANSGTLNRLIDVVQPRETRVYLPVDLDGKAKVSAALYEAVSENANWSTLPASLTRPGARQSTKDAAPRFVHAKIYRFWNRDGRQVMLVGSVNLTSAAHSHARAGNLEASFLVDVSDEGIPKRWWLMPVEQDPEDYAEQDPGLADDVEPVFVDISFRFDWRNNELDYRIDGGVSEPLTVADLSGRELFKIDSPRTDRWIDCSETASEAIRELLKSTSLLKVIHPKGEWRVLVREIGMAHRPSLLMSLTPEEILMYWSLLSEAQREAFISEKLIADAELEGLSVRTHHYDVRDTIFDRFAGIYHAFEQLYDNVTRAVDHNEHRAAEARLFGAKYDSLPELLRKTLEQSTDPVIRYIIFLCAKQLCARVLSRERDFWREHRHDAKLLLSLLDQLPTLADDLPIDDAERDEFLNWYQENFLRMIEQPEEVA